MTLLLLLKPSTPTYHPAPPERQILVDTQGAHRKFVQDPEAMLDYTWDWSGFLAEGEVITDHEVFAERDVLDVTLVAADAFNVTAWLSGGAIGQRDFVTCRITTSLGRTDDRSIYVAVSNR